MYCREISGHYENFTVVSWLTPRVIRPYVHVVYAFARISDDLADVSRDHERFAAWRNQVEALPDHTPEHPVLFALQKTLRDFHMSTEPFLDLLDAFGQDFHVFRYESMSDLLDYCRRSANPVGRIWLRLFGEDRPKLDELSDEVCTGLQLLNFLQDVREDAHSGHVYIPQEWLRVQGIDPGVLGNDAWPKGLLPVLEQMAHETEIRLRKGEELFSLLKWQASYQIKLFIRGGLQALARWRQHPLTEPRRLRRSDYLRISVESLFH